MLRGLHRNNADSALTGSVTETDLQSTSITASTIGATGGLVVMAAGTLAGTAGTKTLRLKLGTTTLATITQAAGTTSDWFFLAFLFNTSANAQRWLIFRTVNDLITLQGDYITSAEDSATNLTLKLTGQLGNAGDTITQTMFDVLVLQIT
jgi:hypothetical protein